MRRGRPAPPPPGRKNRSKESPWSVRRWQWLCWAEAENLGVGSERSGGSGPLSTFGRVCPPSQVCGLHLKAKRGHWRVPSIDHPGFRRQPVRWSCSEPQGPAGKGPAWGITFSVGPKCSRPCRCFQRNSNTDNSCHLSGVRSCARCLFNHPSSRSHV